jgi:hypothetical protein
VCVCVCVCVCVVTHWESQEAILDHVFSGLGIDTDRISHPVLVAEMKENKQPKRKREREKEKEREKERERERERERE